MGRASSRKKLVAPTGYLDGALDDLLVVIPFAELGYSRYHMMLSTNPDYGYMLMTGRILSQIGGYGHQNANDLFREALKIKGWKRLLSLEHDHEFPRDAFRRHAAYTQPIVGGMYFLRDVENPLPVFYMWDKDRRNATNPDAEAINEIITKPGLYPMDCVPMGCTSIAREVLEEWPKDQPFFSSFTNPSGATISHDVFFCRVAQDHGHQPYIDSRLSVSHFCMVPIDKAYFVRWWNQVGAARAMRDAIKDSLKVVAPSDGTKMPKITVAHTKDGLDPATKAAVEATGLGVLYREMVEDEDYYITIATLWAQGQTFVTVEQDIVPAPGMIEEMLNCPEPWCAYGYEYPPFGHYAGMGLAKFSAELLAKLPDAMVETGKWADDKHPPMFWCRVDGWLKQYLTDQGQKQHIHGIVEHHHKGRPAHDCVDMEALPLVKDEPKKSRYAKVTA